MLIQSKCRTCTHPHHGGYCSIVYYGYNNDGSPTDPEYCECLEYIPADNLQYLEWVNEKRSLNK